MAPRVREGLQSKARSTVAIVSSEEISRTTIVIVHVYKYLYERKGELGRGTRPSITLVLALPSLTHSYIDSYTRYIRTRMENRRHTCMHDRLAAMQCSAAHPRPEPLSFDAMK